VRLKWIDTNLACTPERAIAIRARFGELMVGCQRRVRSSVFVAFTFISATMSFAVATAEADPIVFVGFKADQFCCGASSRLGLDWSSDHGLDYFITSDGQTSFSHANFYPANPWPFGLYDTSRSVDMALSRSVSGVDLATEGRIEIGAGGVVTPAVVHQFRHDSSVTGGSFFYGFSESGMLGGDFLFSDVSASSPLYWGVEWDLRITNSQPVANGPRGYATLEIDDAPIYAFANQILGGTQTLSGGLFGSTTSNTLRFEDISGMLSGGAGEAGFTVDVRIAFSGSEFSDIPDASEVPEPGTFLLCVSGLVAAVAARRRSAR
jgi:hypothetical protein